MTKKNKISAASQTVATAWIAPKICRASPQHTVLQISSKSDHYWWNYSRMREHRFWPRRVFKF